MEKSLNSDQIKQAESFRRWCETVKLEVEHSLGLDRGTGRFEMLYPHVTLVKQAIVGGQIRVVWAGDPPRPTVIFEADGINPVEALAAKAAAMVGHDPIQSSLGQTTNDAITLATMYEMERGVPGGRRPQRSIRWTKGTRRLVGEKSSAFGQFESERVPRNSPCPCKSGQKFKHCHGKAR